MRSEKSVPGNQSDLESVLSVYTPSSSLTRISDRPARSQTGGAKSPNKQHSFMSPEIYENVNLLQIQLAETMEENAFLKARLNAEMKLKRSLEGKNIELSQNLAESKKVLQSTGAALMQVHHQTNEMKSKRDERELQLSNAMSRNKDLQVQIDELEARLEELQFGNNPSQTMMETYKKMLTEKADLIVTLEEQQTNNQVQLSQLRKETILLKEAKDEMESKIEEKDRKIGTLLKKVSLLEEELKTVEDNLVQSIAASRATAGAGLTAALNSSQKVTLPTNNESAAAVGTIDHAAAPVLSTSVKQIETQLESFEGNRRSLEERLALLEKNYTSSTPVQSADTNSASITKKKESAPAGQQQNPADSNGTKERSAAAAVRFQEPSDSNQTVAANRASTGEILGDVLFSADSVVTVEKAPNKVLDKPTSRELSAEAPAPTAAAAPAAATATATTTQVTAVANGSSSTDGIAAGGIPVEREWLNQHAGGAVPPDAAPKTTTQAAMEASESIPPPSSASSNSQQATPISRESSSRKNGTRGTINRGHPKAGLGRPNSSGVGGVGGLRARSRDASSRELNSAATEATATDAPSDDPKTAANGSANTNAVAAAATTPLGATSSSVEFSELGSPAPSEPPTPSSASARAMAGYTKEMMKSIGKRQEGEADADFIARLQKEKKKIKRDIYIWTKEFVAKNKKQPAREDREKLAAPLFRSYRMNGKALQTMGVVSESTKSGKMGSVDVGDDDDNASTS